MRRSLNEISGYHLQAMDDEIGRCKDFLFDDRGWVVRYMVADTHAWLPGGRKVLISPISLGEPSWEHKSLPVKLMREAIEKAPSLDKRKPVSREYENAFFTYYGYGLYWTGVNTWGPYPNPAPLVDSKASDPSVNKPDMHEGHLRSANEVKGYDIEATDGAIGHVADFILSDDNWAIVYLVVDTSNWLPGGRKVLIAPDWLKSVSWAKRGVNITLSVQQVKDSPQFDPDVFVDQKYEEKLHRYYAFIRNK
jgi:hypothetical protein